MASRRTKHSPKRAPQARKQKTRSAKGPIHQYPTEWSWVLGAIAYGLAWPTIEGVNLSWLAWGAFVPLFRVLEHQQHFWPYATRVTGFMLIAGLIYSSGWLFGVPVGIMVWSTAAGLWHLVMLIVPLLLLFFVKRRVPYQQALFALVLIWPLWEWGRHQFPLSLNFLWVSNSQGANTWLIQYIDLFGAWAITAWVVLFNVLLYHAHAGTKYRFTLAFRKRALRIAALMLVPPLVYGAVRYVMLQPEDAPIRVTMISTNHPPSLDRRVTLAASNIERVVHVTDSAAYYNRGPKPDLYVWSEGALGFDWEVGNLRSFLYQAIDDWQTPLLTGISRREVRPTSAPDTVISNQAVLIHPGGDSTRTLHAYTKMQLMPMQEGVPWYDYLQTFPSVRAYHAETFKMTPGDAIALLPLQVADGRTIQLAAPICHEVNYPELWAEMTQQGADVFVLPSFESWFGRLGFQNILANVTRLRTIENRRSTARNANGGPTVFIDAFGTMHHPAPKPESSTSASVAIYSGTSLYVRFPYLFPILCVVGLGALLIQKPKDNVS